MKKKKRNFERSPDFESEITSNARMLALELDVIYAKLASIDGKIAKTVRKLEKLGEIGGLRANGF